METEEIRIENIRRDCQDKKLHAYGFSYLYTLKAQKYERGLQIINYIGLAVPLIIGGFVMTYGTDHIGGLIIVGGSVLLVQLAFSAFAMVFKWDEELAYCIEAAREHSFLAQDFTALGAFAPRDYDELVSRYSTLRERNRSRSSSDLKHDVGEKAKIKGMRWALREFQKECAGCHIIPLSMNKTDCTVCGKF